MFVLVLQRLTNGIDTSFETSITTSVTFSPILVSVTFVFLLAGIITAERLARKCTRA